MTDPLPPTTSTDPNSIKSMTANPLAENELVLTVLDFSSPVDASALALEVVNSPFGEKEFGGWALDVERDAELELPSVLTESVFVSLVGGKKMPSVMKLPVCEVTRKSIVAAFNAEETNVKANARVNSLNIFIILRPLQCEITLRKFAN